MMELFVFVGASAMVLVGAVGVITRTHPVHAALSLILTLFEESLPPAVPAPAAESNPFALEGR